jgi:NAD(P)-dependent dehydrogenase (short-subunit alcohol dehydrogenase family)
MAGSVVLVTGGGRGVGRGITEAFLREGADAAICGRHRPDELPMVGGAQAVFFECDVRDPEQVTALIDAVVDRFGRLDVAINHAGGSPPADAATASPRFTTAIITLNLIAPMVVAQRANLVMQEQAEGGLIINIASVNGMEASPGTAAYGAAKAGLINVTESLAVAWAPKVRVNCVTAGAIETEELRQNYGGEAYITALVATVPLGRIGEPADVANLCLFVASPLARHISGSNLVVHGGGRRPAFDPTGELKTEQPSGA